jgi:hypothetical protein
MNPAMPDTPGEPPHAAEPRSASSGLPGVTRGLDQEPLCGLRVGAGPIKSERLDDLLSVERLDDARALVWSHRPIGVQPYPIRLANWFVSK